MKRGLASPSVHSAFAITRRRRDQLSTVDHEKSLNARRAGPRLRHRRRLGQLALISATSRGLSGKTEHKVHVVGLAPAHESRRGRSHCPHAR